MDMIGPVGPAYTSVAAALARALSAACLLRRETASPQERLRARQPATVPRVGVGGVAYAAGGVDEILKPFGGGRVEHVAGLLERAEGVGIEHFRPQIAVITCRITVAGEHMLEMRGAVAQDHLLRQAHLATCFDFDRGRVGSNARSQEVEVHIDKG